MHNSLRPWPLQVGSITALVVQMKAFHYSDCPLLLHLFFFPPVYARPGQLDMIRHYQIQRRLCHEPLVLSRPSLIHQSQTSRLSFFSSPTVFPTVEHSAFLNHDSCQIRHSRSRRSTPRTFPDLPSYCETYPLIYIFSFCPALVPISFQVLNTIFLQHGANRNFSREQISHLEPSSHLPKFMMFKPPNETTRRH
jgi:hypothetical protein